MTRKPFKFSAHNGFTPHAMSAQDIVDAYVDETVATRMTVKLHDLGLIDDQAFLDIIRPVSAYGDITTNEDRT